MIRLSRRVTLMKKSMKNNDSGLGLSELLVTMLLLVVIVALTGTLFTGVMKATTTSRALDGTTKTASNAMNAISQVVRSGIRDPNVTAALASPFVAATSRSMTIYSSAGADVATFAPARVSFSLNAEGQLVEKTWRAVDSGGAWSWPVTPHTRNLGGTFLVDQPLFTYMKDGCRESDPGCKLAIANSGATEAQMLTVAAVSIQLNVSADAKSAKSYVSELTNVVDIPNLGLVSVVP